MFHSPSRAFQRKAVGQRLDDAAELSDVIAALQARDAEITAFATKAQAEIANTGRIATETKAALDKLSADGTALSDRLQAVEQKISARMVSTAAKSLGETFTESEEFAGLAAGRKSSARITVKANTLTSLTTDAAGSVGAAIVPDRLSGILQPAQRSLTIRQLLLPGRTASNAVEYGEEVGFNNNAATRAETGSTAQSDIQFELKTVNVKNIGHFIVASRNILADVPMLQSYIDTRLRFGLGYKEESQLLSGNGTGNNIAGLLQYAAAFDESTYSDGASDTRIDTIRRAVLQVRLAEYDPTFVVLNPIDWAAIELTKDDTGRYIEVSIRDGSGQMRLWRLAVIETTAMTAGQFLVGATMGAQIFDREDATVEVLEQHADNRTNGLVSIIAEERLALAVMRPECFVHGQFELGSSPSINV